jgi:hypothetical protein
MTAFAANIYFHDKAIRVLVNFTFTVFLSPFLLPLLSGQRQTSNKLHFFSAGDRRDHEKEYHQGIEHAASN